MLLHIIPTTSVSAFAPPSAKPALPRRMMARTGGQTEARGEGWEEGSVGGLVGLGEGWVGVALEFWVA
ncbi:unnamed protein product [Closterium sp. NIES-54]